MKGKPLTALASAGWMAVGLAIHLAGVDSVVQAAQ